MFEIETTPSERLFIRRRRDGLTQVQAAEHWGVSTTRYIRWEKALVEGVPDVRLDPPGLEAHEWCLVLRRREKITQQQVSEDIGKCRWWINQMERGLAPTEDLVKFWRTR